MSYEQPNEDIKKSMVHDSSEKGRTNHSWSLVNHCKINPREFNPEYNSYNYEVWINNLEIISSEIGSIMTKEESELCTKVYKLILSGLKFKPPHAQRRNDGFSNKTKTIFNMENWEELHILISIYEKVLREVEDTHDLAGPTKNEEDDFE